jgi:hypothetical protein
VLDPKVKEINFEKKLCNKWNIIKGKNLFRILLKREKFSKYNQNTETLTNLIKEIYRQLYALNSNKF